MGKPQDDLTRSQKRGYEITIKILRGLLHFLQQAFNDATLANAMAASTGWIRIPDSDLVIHLTRDSFRAFIQVLKYVPDDLARVFSTLKILQYQEGMEVTSFEELVRELHRWMLSDKNPIEQTVSDAKDLLEILGEGTLAVTTLSKKLGTSPERVEKVAKILLKTGRLEEAGMTEAGTPRYTRA